MPTDIYQFLKAHFIEYERFDHPPVFTCEEAAVHTPDLEATNTKNLFLRDRKGKRHFLVVTDHEKSVDLTALGKLLEVGKLSFGSADRLHKHLRVEPGSVTVLALLNDPENAVELVVDEDIWKAPTVACHPMVNTSTLVISHAGLTAFLEGTGHEPRIVGLPSRGGR
jgi:Ala-tRNA(Pro) deacylase